MGMIDEDEVGLKEKPEDTRYIKKEYIKIRPEAPGVRAKEHLIPNRESTGVSYLKAPSGCVKCPGHVAPTTGSKIAPPPPPTQGGVKRFRT